MRILVTGVSGTVGGGVARALMRRGHAVVGVTRSDQPVPDGVEPVMADLFDADALVDIAPYTDGAVHAASSNDERSADLDHTVVTALTGTFEGTGKPLVYTSGLWLHGNTGDVPATEDSPFDPPAVVAWRPEVEQRVADAAGRGVRTVRIRPGLLYGHGRGYIPTVLGVQQSPDGNGTVVRHFGDGTNRWSVVHVDDLGDLYALAIESAPPGSVYIGTHEEPIRVDHLAQRIADRQGATVRSWDPADATTYWGPMVEPFLLDQVASSAKALKELGWQPRRPSPADDLPRTAAVTPPS